MTIQRMLEADGHSVAGLAKNGIEAIKMYPEIKPDVVILDITMPEMNGIDTLKRLKVLDPEARIIICSAIGYQDKIADFFESLTTSKDFILLNDGNWDLKINHSVKIDIDDIYEESDSEEEVIDDGDDELSEEDNYEDDSYDDGTLDDDVLDDDYAELSIVDEDELDEEN